MPHEKETIQVLGICSNIGAPSSGCDLGPANLKAIINRRKTAATPRLDWHPLIKFNNQSSLKEVQKLNREISRKTQQFCEKNQRFLIIGGDHSCAIGTWPGVLSQYGDDLGLLWIDAHLDAHNTLTSPSGNLHGMPVAALLGSDDEKLNQIYPNKFHLTGKQLVIFGVRSAEEEEYRYIYSQKVKVYNSSLINSFNNISDAFNDAMEQLGSFSKIGVSLDLDVIDPTIAPAVSTPVPNGLSLEEVFSLCQLIRQEHRLIGLEIAEFNPAMDRHDNTAKLIHSIINQIFANYH